MYNEKKIIAIIPARGGSKGILRKNIRPLAGRPLLAYSVDAAKQSTYVDRVFVSTEDAEIAEVAEAVGAEVIVRPQEFAQDQSPTLPVLTHVLDVLQQKENFIPDLIITLQATSPLRTAAHIDEALQIFFASQGDSLLGVSHIYEHRFETENQENFVAPVTKERLGRQHRKPVIIENGFIYITPRTLLEQGKILGDKVVPYPVGKESSIDIDDLHDFFLAEQLIFKKKEYGNENR